MAVTQIAKHRRRHQQATDEDWRRHTRDSLDPPRGWLGRQPFWPREEAWHRCHKLASWQWAQGKRRKR